MLLYKYLNFNVNTTDYTGHTTNINYKNNYSTLYYLTTCNTFFFNFCLLLIVTITYHALKITSIDENTSSEFRLRLSRHYHAESLKKTKTKYIFEHAS